MPTTVFNLEEARASLSTLVDLASAGEEFVIAKAGRHLAKLVGYEAQRVPRKPGGWEGKVWMADDFDKPLPDELQAGFEGRHND